MFNRYFMTSEEGAEVQARRGLDAVNVGLA
jgi:hypothetical protein